MSYLGFSCMMMGTLGPGESGIKFLKLLKLLLMPGVLSLLNHFRQCLCLILKYFWLPHGLSRAVILKY